MQFRSPRFHAFFVVCLVGGASLAVAVIPARPARASTMVGLSVEDLCQRATLVVAATPVESTVVWEDSPGARGRRIATYTRVRVDRVIDGIAPPVLWIRTLGGTVGDIGQRVDGEAVLAPGQQGLFFLRPFADGPHGVVGMAQGQFRFDRPAPGAPARLLRMPGLPRLLAAEAGAVAAARDGTATLVGKTLDEATQIIRAVRQTNGR